MTNTRSPSTVTGPAALAALGDRFGRRRVFPFGLALAIPAPDHRPQATTHTVPADVPVAA